MTPQSTLDLKGNFRTNPFAELLVEIDQAKLGGSLRLSHKERKSIIYFREGEVVFGVSNSREHRLLSIIVELKKADSQQLARLAKSANDVEFATLLVKEDILSKDDVDALVVTQIERIILDGLSWPEGDFVFSPLVKPREDLVFRVDFHKLLIDYARCQPASAVSQRFKSVQESFEAVAGRDLPRTCKVMSTLYSSSSAAKSSTSKSSSRSARFPNRGFYRHFTCFGSADSSFATNGTRRFRRPGSAIRNAKVSLVKGAQKSAVGANGNAEKPADATAEPGPQPEIVSTSEIPVVEISLKEYLERTEKAETHYDVLGVLPFGRRKRH